MAPHLRLAGLLGGLPNAESPLELARMDLSDLTYVSLAAMAAWTEPLPRIAPMWRPEVQRRGGSWFAERILAHVRPSGDPTGFAQPLFRFDRTSASCRRFACLINSVEPPWHVTRMPGGVGGLRREASLYPDQCLLSLCRNECPVSPEYAAVSVINCFTLPTLR